MIIIASVKYEQEIKSIRKKNNIKCNYILSTMEIEKQEDGKLK